MGRMGSSRRPRLSSVLVLAGVFLAAAPGWVLGPRLPAAGGAAPDRRADWQPSPMAQNWAAPVLPPAGGAPGAGRRSLAPPPAQPLGPRGAAPPQAGAEGHAGGDDHAAPGRPGRGAPRRRRGAGSGTRSTWRAGCSAGGCRT